MKHLFLITTILLIGFIFNSCKKEKEDKEKYDQSTAPISNAKIENAYDEMTNMSDQAMKGDLVYYKSPKVTFVYVEKESTISFLEKEACNVLVTLDTISTTRTITIDWGSTNCDCNDGKQRRGKIITTFTGKYRDQGTVITHTPIDYYVNNNKIEGTKTVSNMGLNSNGHPYFNVIIDGTVTMSNGDVFTYHSTRVRTWTNGYTTLLNFFDDEYDITGNANATSTNNNGYVANITSPLHIKVGCPYITSGKVEFTPTDKPLRIIDYGSGICDATFTVTINGVTYTING